MAKQSGNACFPRVGDESLVAQGFAEVNQQTGRLRGEKLI